MEKATTCWLAEWQKRLIDKCLHIERLVHHQPPSSEICSLGGRSLLALLVEHCYGLADVGILPTNPWDQVIDQQSSELRIVRY